MPYTFTVSDARASVLKNIAGVCTSSAEFLDFLNEATERLMTAGNWFGTEQLGQFCLYNRCVTWPRYVGTVLGVRLCSHSVDIKNHWYSILGPAQSCLNGNLGGFYPVLKDIGTAPTYNEISGPSGKKIRAYALKNQDYGKTVKLFGIDSNGQPLQETDGSGNWQMGLTLILAPPFVSTSIDVVRIESVLKDRTQGNVLLYEYDATSDTLRDLALYEPSETNPRYRRSNFSGLCVGASGCVDAHGEKIVKVEALIKLQYIPVVSDNDFLLIDDFVALKQAVQGVRYEEAGEIAKAGAYFASAVHTLNLRDRDKMPGNQTTIVVNPLSGSEIWSPI